MKHIFLTLCLWFPLAALATVDGYKYPFDDPQDAARFEQLAQDLRCPKCQNQNLADSNAPVAVDLRDKVYELMQEGQSDDEIVGYLVDRYGDFVRYNPPFRAETVLLWFGPALVFVFGLLLLVLIRRGQKQPPKPLSAEEQARLQALKNKAKSS
ncbi:MAG: cytochrome c-type biogenesis protein CcmH [Saccharospirillaceae bacterium]|nr:cytochrome c-type biogenesis protein CcmH [Saccharospirillaceae bacterium]MCD8531028.1 cytochrome c-type biogenesis protein CcmH [Saccharospirillaceae bacterium]